MRLPRTRRSSPPFGRLRGADLPQRRARLQLRAPGGGRRCA
jgi:hypothetical protein